MNPIGQSVIRRSGERAFRNWQQLLDEWDERWCQASLTFCQQIRRFFFVFANSVIWCRAEDWASWMWQLLIRTTHIRRRFIPFIAVHFCLFFFSSLFWLIRRVHNTDFPIQCEWCTLFIYLRCFLFDMFVGRFCFFFFVFHFRVRLRIVRECKHANWNGDEANEICARAGRLSVECWCMYAFAASLIFAFMVVSFEWWRQEHHMHRIQNVVHFLTQAWCEECVWHDVWIIVCLCALPTTYSLVRYTKRGAVEHV